MNATMTNAVSAAIPPYFDVVFQRIRENEPETATAFGRHVHWGFWKEPERAAATASDYADAAERLCRRVCDAAQVRDGTRVLDVGCGFGGTIASLNERFTGLHLTGLNIDPRQLARAAQQVQPRPGSEVRWVEGDACRLSFPPNSFDVVLAVECIFHFPDRAAFFAGAARALPSGGRLALSDFVPTEEALPVIRSFGTANDEATRFTYGHIDVLCSLAGYRRLADAAGLDLVHVDDINVHTMPTYTFLRKNMKTWHIRSEAKLFDRATARLESVCREGMLHYTVLGFRKR